jgi:hypothetical protein
VRVAAADEHGFAILRSGETLSVITSGPRNVIQTSPAVFEDDTKNYIAHFANLTVAGSYVDELVSVLSRATKASFTLACAQGYVASSQGDCQPRRSVCEAAAVAPQAGGFVVQGQMILSNLGSARSIELMPVSNATSFNVSTSGQATVRFVAPGVFLVRVIDSDGAQCALSQQLLVGCPIGLRLIDGGCRCPAGYQEVNGNCQPVLADDVCTGLGVTDSAGAPIGGSRTFTLGDRLRLSLNSSKPASAYRFQLVPTHGIVTGSVAEAILLDQTGPFIVVAQYAAAGNAPVQCPLIAMNVTAPQRQSL